MFKFFNPLTMIFFDAILNWYWHLGCKTFIYEGKEPSNSNGLMGVGLFCEKEFS